MIIAIENGEIVQMGSHEELLQNKGLYEKLYNIQYDREKKTHYRLSPNKGDEFLVITCYNNYLSVKPLLHISKTL